MSRPDRFTDRVAIVCGAGCVGPGWGNGRAVAVGLAAEGAKVFAVDLHLSALDETVSRIEEIGGTVETYLCDATKSDQVAAMVEACIARFDRVDILVNCVGGSAAGGAVEMDEAVWNAQLAFNLTSVFLT